MAIIRSSAKANIDTSLTVLDFNNCGVLAYDASSTVTLESDKTYLLIATTACYFHFTAGSEAADAADSFYLPADSYVTFKTGVAINKLYAVKHTDAGAIHYCKMS